MFFDLKGIVVTNGDVVEEYAMELKLSDLWSNVRVITLNSFFVESYSLHNKYNTGKNFFNTIRNLELKDFSYRIYRYDG